MMPNAIAQTLDVVTLGLKLRTPSSQPHIGEPLDTLSTDAGMDLIPQGMIRDH